MFDQTEWDEIGKLRRTIFDSFQATGEFSREAVRKAEDRLRAFDQNTGFSALQLKSHSIAFRLESSAGSQEMGRFEPSDLIRAIESSSELTSILRDGFGRNVTLKWCGLVPGSDCAVADFDSTSSAKRDHTPDENTRRNVETEKVVVNLIEAAAILDGNETPAEKTRLFQEKTGLSAVKAHETMLRLAGLRASHQTVQLMASSTKAPVAEQSTATLTVGPKTETKIHQVKNHLRTVIEPDLTRVVAGKIVELDHRHDEKLKFGLVATPDDKLYTISYPTSQDAAVKARKGTIVRVEMTREGPTRPWNFASWS